ncbi:MAG: NAD(P)H-binding protein [Bacteroidales bacterium]|nr:NAD(P)H-binding protein [Bacteroidales bacterium]
MIAIVIGATGATGKDLVQMLLSDSDFSEVNIFVRREVDITSPKLRTHIVDFNEVDSWKDELKGDVLFSMMGTTRSQAGGKKNQWVVDYDYQYNVAKAAAENGVEAIELMSSIGANEKSVFFYSKMKGELEKALAKLRFKKVVITRPPSLIRKNSDRVGEKVSLSVLKVFNKLGMLKKLAPMPTEQVARAMINTAKDNISGIRIIESDQIRVLSSAI